MHHVQKVLTNTNSQTKTETIAINNTCQWHGNEKKITIPISFKYQTWYSKADIHFRLHDMLYITSIIHSFISHIKNCTPIRSSFNTSVILVATHSYELIWFPIQSVIIDLVVCSPFPSSTRRFARASRGLVYLGLDYNMTT